MLDGLKNFLGMGPKADLGELIRKGALILDVRTPGEYAGGHVKGSVNIPLNLVDASIEKLKKKNQVIITCCASGMRSASARNILLANGIEAHNGGSWQNVQRYIS